MGVPAKDRTGKADGPKPSKPHIPSAKEAQKTAPRGSGKVGVKG